MRVNVDSQALHDPRFRRAAKGLQVSHHEVLARMIRVWMVCYDRREASIPIEDVDIAAELDGFATAIVTAELADLVSPTEVYIRGVTARIEFLDRQSDRGKQSGKARRERSHSLQTQRGGQQSLAGLGGEPPHQNEPTFNERSGDRSTGDRTYSLAPDQALAPDHALDLSRRGEPHQPGPERVSPESRVPAGQRTGTARLFAVPPPQDSGEGEKAPQNAAGEATGKAKRQPPEPPEAAFTLAHLLLQHVTANHPGARLAVAPERLRESTAMRWAQSIDKLHRIDGFEWGAIEGMITWCQRDSFWKGVILGADNLRDKWDKMAAQRTTRGNGNRQGNEPRRGPTALALDEHAELLRAEQADRGNT